MSTGWQATVGPTLTWQNLPTIWPTSVRWWNALRARVCNMCQDASDMGVPLEPALPYWLAFL